MKTTRTMGVAALVVASSLGPHTAWEQLPGTMEFATYIVEKGKPLVTLGK